jgi:hypothetical protein
LSNPHIINRNPNLLFSRKKAKGDLSLKPPKLDVFDLIALYAFKAVILVIFLYGLYELLRAHIHW